MEFNSVNSVLRLFALLKIFFPFSPTALESRAASTTWFGIFQHIRHCHHGLAGRLLIQSLMACAARESTRLCESSGIFTVGTVLVMR
jgi:hypothetical protein